MSFNNIYIYIILRVMCLVKKSGLKQQIVRRKFDITESATQDLASDTGFLLALRNTLRLRPGAILWGGVPCSTFLG